MSRLLAAVYSNEEVYVIRRIHRSLIGGFLIVGLAACGGPSQPPADATAVAPEGEPGVSQPQGDQTAYPANPTLAPQDNAATGYPGVVPMEIYPSPAP